MGILGRLFRGGGVKWDDEPLQAQTDAVNRIPHFAEQLGPECDELPSASGPFGVCGTNPIPVNGPAGEVFYINRLATKAGRPFFFHRLRTQKTSVSPHPVDQYELLAIDGSLNLHLFFAMYHPRRSQHVPAGLIRFPWDRMTDRVRLLCKLPVFGTTFRVEDFPWGLPDAVRVRLAQEHLEPDTIDFLARSTEGVLAELRERMKA